MAFSPEGCRIVSAPGDNTVRVWEASTGAQLACLRGHEAIVTSVGFANHLYIIVLEGEAGGAGASRQEAGGSEEGSESRQAAGGRRQ